MSMLSFHLHLLRGSGDRTCVLVVHMVRTSSEMVLVQQATQCVRL
jgi:hypothetical protein